MTEQLYEKLTAPFRKNPGILSTLLLCNKLMTMMGYIFYPAMIAWLLYNRRIGVLICYIVVPGASFVLLSLYRSKVDKPRPYEALAINPLIHKDTKGHSFPSRHIFSIFLIATCWYSLAAPIGLLLGICGLFLAFIRVIGGVHYPIDVTVGAIVGILCGLLTYVTSVTFTV